jgi:hypothetical protein
LSYVRMYMNKGLLWLQILFLIRCG